MQAEARDRSLLADLLRAAGEASAFVEGMSKDRFLKDLKTQKAVERELEIMGEAARGLSQAARERHPQVPFRSIIGMRNILAHDYGRVDVDELWKTAKESLPALIEALKG